MTTMDHGNAPALKQGTGQAGLTAATPADWVALLRPHHWIKNVVVLAGPAASLKLASWSGIQQAFYAFAAFCLASSATYAVNDVLDRRADANHPKKRSRPVARGAIGVRTALTTAVVLFFLALLLSSMLETRGVLIVVTLYFIMTLAYSITLKERVILDVIIIASGFVLRAWAGTLAVDAVASEWFIACVFTLCLFMGFGKRRSELAMIGNLADAGQHRRTLLRYTPDFLNHLITVSAGIAVITFLLYTLDTSGQTPFHKEHLFYTLPLVVYGIFRFAMLSELGTYSGPTEVVLKDRAIFITFTLWTIAALFIAYETTIFGPRGLEGLLGIPLEHHSGIAG